MTKHLELTEFYMNFIKIEKDQETPRNQQQT